MECVRNFWYDLIKLLWDLLMDLIGVEPCGSCD